MSVQILIGLKPLSSAKQRLMPHLSPADRRTLMSTMLTTVMTAARASQLGPVALATSEPEAPGLASSLGVAVVSDGGLPWNDGLVHARDQVINGSSSVLYLAGDLPLLRAADLLAFRDAAPSPGVVVARARDLGTNALLVTPARAFTPMFGQPRSSEVHRVSATRLGLPCRVIDIAGLALDVDTIEDAWDAGILSRVTETGRGLGRG
jgi:2-phospho-L-lactate guanylyltransferase